MDEKKIKKLNKLLEYVINKNEFYNNFYKDLVLPVRSIEELKILERKTIRVNSDDIISSDLLKENLKYDRTNGTTEGKPLEIYKLQSEWIALDLDLWNLRRRINKEAAQKYAFYYFNGNDYSEQYRLYIKGNRTTLQLPMKKKSEEDFIEDLHMIQKQNIKWIIAPPSIIFSLCCVSVKYNLKVDIEIIESISEYLPHFYKKFFEKVFSGKVYVHYSCHEIWGMGFTNEDGKLQIMDECILQAVKDERFKRGYGKCIATNLRVKSMPFINYELSDLIKIDGNTLKTYGFRWNEEVRLENGNIHCSFFDNIYYEYKEFELLPLENYQIVYNKNIIVIYIITDNIEICEKVKIYTSDKIKEIYGYTVDVKCKIASRFFVDIISGKMRGIIRYEDINWDGWEFHLINDVSKKFLQKLL